MFALAASSPVALLWRWVAGLSGRPPPERSKQGRSRKTASVVTFVFIVPSFQRTRTLELVLGFKLLADRRVRMGFPVARRLRQTELKAAKAVFRVCLWSTAYEA
jgi:hypothetical protein